MKYALRVAACADGSPSLAVGQYIVEFEPPGPLVLSSELREARQFASFGDALAYWQREFPQGIGGRNMAGRPNRPLTAYTMEVVRTEEEKRDGSEH